MSNLVKVVALGTYRREGKTFKPGSKFDLDKKEAERLINLRQPAVKYYGSDAVVDIEKAEILNNSNQNDEPDADSVKISDLTVEELKEEIKDREGSFSSEDKKADLVAILTNLIESE